MAAEVRLTVLSPQNLVVRRHDVDLPGRAQAQLDEFRAKMPRHPQVAFLEALVALESQDAARARERIAAVLKVAPDDMRALYVGAAAEYRLGNWLQAEK